MKTKSAALFVALFLAAATAVVQAAPLGFLTIAGTKQGAFKGETVGPRKEAIAIVGFSEELSSPRDPASGLPTGKRMHKPLVITKEIDGSSPQFYTAMVTNENLKTFQLDLVRPEKTGAGGAGVETTYYTIKLTNANVANIRHYTQETNGKTEILEEISFTYQKIEVDSPAAKTSATDDWESRQ